MKLISSARKLRFLAAVVFVVSAALPLAAQDATKLAQAVQNPVSDLISVPFQYNANFDVGVDKSVQHVLNIQPVYPIKLNPSWNLITRTIIPVISQPPLAAGQDRQSGLGDVQLSLFMTPAKASKFIWGAGLVGQFDTATDDLLGQGKWGLGPTAVALKISGPWVVGAW